LGGFLFVLQHCFQGSEAFVRKYCDHNHIHCARTQAAVMEQQNPQVLENMQKCNFQ
jgi:hypothetical protein